MKICLVGGIFDKSSEYRAKHLYTPETVLYDGLSAAGFEVTTSGHLTFKPSDVYDIVHVHHLGKAAVRMALAPTRSSFVFTGHCGPLLTNYEKSIKLKLAFKYILRNADSLIGLSDTECQFLQQTSRTTSKIIKIPNGIPSDIFFPFPRANNLFNRPLQILYVGQLIKSKGVDVLFKSLEFIKKKIPFELLLVYQNSKQEDLFIEMAKDLKINKNINFLGFLSATELSNIYRNVDVLALPSYAEALPSVITESLLCGTPIVATNVGGIPEQISCYGELVAPGDWKNMGEAFIRIFNNLAFYRNNSQEMHDYAKKNFSIERMINDHIQAYTEVLKQTNNRKKKNHLIKKLLSSFI